MPATMRRSNEPAKTVTVKNVEIVSAEVDKLLSAKYLGTSHQSLPSPLLERNIA